LFVCHDNLGAGGPLELHVLHKSPAKSGYSESLLWLDREARGLSFIVCSSASGRPNETRIVGLTRGDEVAFSGRLLRDREGAVTIKPHNSSP